MGRLAWLVPALIDGSGGHRTFLRCINALSKDGHECQLYVEGSNSANRTEARNAIRRLFGFEFEHVEVGFDKIRPPVDLVFATAWHTAKVARDLPFPCKKAYFVQDWEALFNPVGDGYLQAENSYRYGLATVTMGRWLQHELQARFAVSSSHIDFCADLDIYRSLPNVRRKLAICFLYQPDKPRRCPSLGVEALGIVKHYMPAVKIYLYGSNTKGPIWFEHEHLGLLPLDDCNILYNHCALGLSLSASNPSRVPFEMMAAGLPVVELYRESTLYDFPPEATLLCDQTQESIAEGIMSLLANEQKRQEMATWGISFMRKRPIKYELNQFRVAVREILDGPQARVPAFRDVARCYDREPVVSTHFMGTLPRSVPVSSAKNRVAAVLSRLVRFLPARSLVKRGFRWWMRQIFP